VVFALRWEFSSSLWKSHLKQNFHGVVRGKNAPRLANLQNVFELQNKRIKRRIYCCHDKQSVDKDILFFFVIKSHCCED
jgi:hypothetical protein